jgi:hypothetical protein|tara:strand:- start:170 stop:358 length:189 start_codon:yes stop_codon:yes gene_type:complete
MVKSILGCIASVVFVWCFRMNEFAGWAYWAGQSSKWFVMAFTNERTNRFGMGSVDFHWKTCH